MRPIRARQLQTQPRLQDSELPWPQRELPREHPGKPVTLRREPSDRLSLRVSILIWIAFALLGWSIVVGLAAYLFG
jgi:hypothetical protein